MKSASFIVSLSMAFSGAVLAQQSTGVQGSAAGGAQAAATADKEGASANASGDGAAAATTDRASAGVNQGTQLNATLSRPVDARNAKAGDEITATVSEDVKSDGHVLIKRGSKLVGRVTTARALSGKSAAEGGAGSQLGIVFNRAVLKNGTTIPLSATVHALAAAESSASSQMSDANAGLAGAGSAAGSARSSGGGLVGGVAGGASGAVGGVTGRTGAIANGTVFGLKGIDVSPGAGSDAKGSIISSSTQNVRLDRGTRMLLVNGGAAGAATVEGSQSRATAPSEPAPPAREPVDRR